MLWRPRVASVSAHHLRLREADWAGVALPTAAVLDSRLLWWRELVLLELQVNLGPLHCPFDGLGL